MLTIAGGIVLAVVALLVGGAILSEIHDWLYYR